MKCFDRIWRLLQREPWWAELWSAVTALAWAGLGWGSTSGITFDLDAWPSMQVLLRLGGDQFWHSAAAVLGIAQLLFLALDRRWLRWMAAVAGGWFWAVLTLGVWAAVPWAPAVAVYAGWCGVNVISILRLPHRHGWRGHDR